MEVPTTLEPTFQGCLATKLDALTLLEACLRGQFQFITRRPLPKELHKLVKSGNVFIFNVHGSGINRLIDGYSWSPSRSKDNFYIYCEVDKHLAPSTKNGTLKRKRSVDVGNHKVLEHNDYISGLDSEAAISGCSLESTTSTEMRSDFSSDEQSKGLKHSLDSFWTNSHDFLEDGLVKKTMSIQIQGTTLRVISYYRTSDVMNKRLARPTELFSLGPKDIRQELSMGQRLHQPINEPENHMLTQKKHDKYRSRTVDQTARVSSPKVTSQHKQATNRTPLGESRYFPTSLQPSKQLLDPHIRSVHGHGKYEPLSQSDGIQTTDDSGRRKHFEHAAPCGLEPLGFKVTKTLTDHAEQLIFPNWLSDTTSLSYPHDSEVPFCWSTRPAVVRQSYASFLDHIHLWYPIFHVPHLKELIENFILRYNQPLHCSSTIGCGRERQLQHSMEPSSADFTVLLVLALGQMCLHTASSSPIHTNVTQSANQMQSDCNHRNKVSGPTVLPQCACGCPRPSPRTAAGIEPYFAKHFEDAGVPESFYSRTAKQCPENLAHDNDLLVAQSHLLLGLYKARKAGMKGGSASFRSAGNKLHDLLIQRNLLTGNAEDQLHSQIQLLPTGQPVGVIVLAATSCLRLEMIQNASIDPCWSQLYHVESLPLPFSSPGSPTEHLPSANTNKHRDTFFQDHVALAILERQSHDFSQKLRQYSHPSYIPRDVLDLVHGNEKALLDFREWLPRDLELDSNDFVLSVVLRAQIRAKYYETMYRIHEPFLEFVLHILPHLMNGFTVRQAAEFNSKSLYDERDICRFRAFATMDTSMIYEGCKECIEAATVSARSYYSLLRYPSPLEHQDIAYT